MSHRQARLPSSQLLCPKGKLPWGLPRDWPRISDDESDVDADESGSDEEEDEDDKTQEVEGRSLRNVTRAEPKCYRDPDSDLDLGDDLKVPVRRKLKVPKTPSPKKVGKVTKKLKTPLKVPKKIFSTHEVQTEVNGRCDDGENHFRRPLLVN
jgi:hypothetical protein